eukprot:COSAG04_NODE_2964_length_3339_cov_1.641358_1_plen_596_part_00
MAGPARRGWCSALPSRASRRRCYAAGARRRSWAPLLGTGTEESQGGARYKGGMRKGRRHGKGTMRWADGRRYVGEWKEGHRDGRGRLTKNGQLLYDGAWRDGSPSGNGTMISKEGEYRGSFAAGQRHGQGKLTTPDGSVSYRGGWRLGRCDGRGTLSFASGVKLKGDWRGGRLVGDAALSRPSVPGEGVQTDARLPLALQAGSTVREAKGQAAQQCGGRDASRFRVRDDSTGEELDDKMTMRQAKLQDDDCLQVLAKVPFLDLPQGELRPEEQAAMRERLAEIEASRGKLEKKRQEAELRGGKLTCSCPLCDEEMSALDHTEAELRRRLGGWGLGAWTGALDPDRMDVADLRVMVPHEQHDSEGKPFVIDLPHPLSPEQRSAVTRWLGNGRSDMLHPPHRGEFSGRLHLIDTNAKPDMFGAVKDRLEIVCGRLAAAEEGRPIVLEGLRETKTTAQLAERLAAAEVRTLPQPQSKTLGLQSLRDAGEERCELTRFASAQGSVRVHGYAELHQELGQMSWGGKPIDTTKGRTLAEFGIVKGRPGGVTAVVDSVSVDGEWESEPVRMREEVVLRGQLTQDGQSYEFQVDQHGRLSLLE